MICSLEGTVALVTGASSGIGAATAAALATQGAAVALVARRRERLECVAGQIRSRKGAALIVEADVSEEEEVADAVDCTVAEFGRLDILVNCAGVMMPGAVHSPTSEWREMIATNVLGLLYCARAAVPHLLRAAGIAPRYVGDMVNIGSTLGRFPRGGNAVYSATKAAVAGFTEAMRQELAQDNVRVSIVEPGAVDTELVKQPRPDALRATDISEIITYIVTRPRRVCVDEVLVRPLRP